MTATVGKALLTNASRLLTIALCLTPIGTLAPTLPAAQEVDWNDYVTGMTVVGKPGAGVSCPPIVWIVEPDSPAAKAGISPGDRLLSVDGHRVVDITEARPLLRTKDPKSSLIELQRDTGSYTVEVGRIKDIVIQTKHGWMLGPDGDLYPVDASSAEMQRISQIQREPPRERNVFNVGHYPANPDLYYPGFELFVWTLPSRSPSAELRMAPRDGQASITETP